MNEIPKHLVRQYDLLPPSKTNIPISIVGAGAIGSHVALYLAKMGYANITVWDDDGVSEENMNSQGYRRKDVGFKKVDALYDIIEEYTAIKVTKRAEKYLENSEMLNGIVICAADSMAVRKYCWEINKLNPFMKAYIDTRMGAENALLYCIKPDVEADVTEYEKTLWSDSDAVQLPCTAKATCYTATMLSGLACKAVKDITMDLPYPQSAQWSIKDHALMIWKGGINVHTHIKTA